MKKVAVLTLVLFLFLTMGCATKLAPVNLEKANPTTLEILAGAEIEPMALQDDMQFYLDLIFGFLPMLQESGNGLLSEIMNVFSLILSGGGGTCPVVTVTPPISGLSIPPEITVVADYGGGCVAADGSTMSGSWKLRVTNIQQTLTGISADYVFTAANLSQNGMMLANGSISGSLSLAPSGSNQKVTVSAQFNDMHASEYATITGSVKAEATGQVGLSGASFDKVVVTPMGLTLSYNVLLLSGSYTITRGSVVSQRQGSSETFVITADLSTSSGTIAGTAMVESPTGGYYRINTMDGPFTANGYSIYATNVVLQPQVCIYPLDGTLQVTKGAEETGVAFSDACDGTYIFY